MKKLATSIAAVICLAAPLVAGAATPAAPVFNAAVKVADGKVRGTNNKVAVDGSTVYAAYEDCTPNGNAPFHVGRSANSGATWGLSAIPDQTAVGIADITRVAVGIDPVYSGQKIVHTVWKNSAGDVMYAYFATRPTQTGWSTPVRINGSHVYYDQLDLVVTGDGAIHVLIDNYYTTASTPDSIFTEPVELPATGLGSIAKDAQDNLYVALSDGANITLTKNVGGSGWTAPVTVTAAGTAVSGLLGLAVADANTYYIGYADATTSAVKLAVTTNGGSNWTRRTAFTLPAGYSGDSVAVAVTSSKILTLVAGTGLDASGNRINKVKRTSDNGVTWSPAVTIPGDDSEPSIALDANNKAMILIRDGQSGQDWSGVRSNNNANLIFIKEK